MHLMVVYIYASGLYLWALSKIYGFIYWVNVMSISIYHSFYIQYLYTIYDITISCLQCTLHCMCTVQYYIVVYSIVLVTLESFHPQIILHPYICEYGEQQTIHFWCIFQWHTHCVLQFEQLRHMRHQHSTCIYMYSVHIYYQTMGMWHIDFV